LHRPFGQYRRCADTGRFTSLSYLSTNSQEATLTGHAGGGHWCRGLCPQTSAILLSCPAQSPHGRVEAGDRPLCSRNRIGRNAGVDRAGPTSAPRNFADDSSRKELQKQRWIGLAGLINCFSKLRILLHRVGRHGKKPSLLVALHALGGDDHSFLTALRRRVFCCKRRPIKIGRSVTATNSSRIHSERALRHHSWACESQPLVWETPVRMGR
jgi:hypothetical protein